MANPTNVTQAERITALEVRVSDLLKTQQETNNKLDELLAMRHKGIGAFWLASTLLGTGIVGFIVQFIDWARMWRHA